MAVAIDAQILVGHDGPLACNYMWRTYIYHYLEVVADRLAICLDKFAGTIASGCHNC
jgi:hypothetical protein